MSIKVLTGRLIEDSGRRMSLQTDLRLHLEFLIVPQHCYPQSHFPPRSGKVVEILCRTV